MITNKPVRVIHIFPPSLRSRFGGQNIYWKSVFASWNCSEIIHFVLDTKNNQLLEAGKALDFKYDQTQKMISKWERITWIFSLLKNLLNYQRDFDVIHAHVLWWGGLLLGLWANLKGIPTLYESVLLNEDSPSGIINQRFGNLKLWCLKRYSSILTISDSLTEDYLKFGFRSSQVHTLMNAVDTDVFNPVESETEKLALRRKYSLPEGDKVLIFVGSLIQRKGVDLLIRAFITASKEYDDLHLLLVGARNKQENPSLVEDFVSNLHKALEENGVSNKVTFLGLIQDRDQLADLYRLSDVFVFPSRNEGLGNVVLEAMACGLPVIVSRLPVLKKVIANGQNGIFVPLEDADALAHTIIQLAAELAICQSLGQAANRYTITHHSYAKWQARIADLYRSLLQDK